MTGSDPIATLFARLNQPFSAEGVFDCLSDVVYFIKNERAEYLVVNRTLAERCGTQDKRILLGKTTLQVFPPPFGRSFWEQDIRLLTTGEPVLNQLELHLYPTGMTGWCLTNKFPLRGTSDATVGIVGVSHDLHPPDERAEEYSSVAAAVSHARAHLDCRLATEDLAAIAGLSSYQFDQRVRRLFRLSTGQLLLKMRMDRAAEQLRDTTRQVVEIGLACGYADQSAFTRQFRRTTGLTPGEYRRAFRVPSSTATV